MINTIRAILFNFIFWPIFCLHLTIMNPFAHFFSQKTTFRLVYRPVTKWLVFCLKYLASIKYKIENLDILKKTSDHTPIIIGCNHQSTWETLIFSLLFKEITVVAKRELFKLPIAGIFFKKLRCIPVDRSSPVSAIKSLLKHGKIAKENKQSILIFPNGTRSAEKDEIEYKSGVFALYKTLNMPVIPAHVNSGKYWPRRTFKKKKGTIILSIKNPIMPGLEKDEFFKVFEDRMKG